MSLLLNGTDGVTYNDGTLQSSAPVGKNLIINGDMRIAQRGTSTASITSGGYYTTDRIQFYVATAGTWTMSQNTDVPSGQGFSYSTKVDCTTADASLGANDIIQLAQRIEGQNIQHLKYGTSNAESLTLSFWVKTNKTGTYVAELRAYDAGSGTRIIAQNYTVSSADTWEKKTLTYVGDTATAIRNTNTDGLVLYLWLAAGSTFTSGTLATSWQSYTAGNRAVGQINLADNTANYINITGVQLETGTTATDFENLQYGTQLALCQRYFQSFGGSNVNETVGQGTSFSTTNTYVLIHLLQTMRSVPSLGYTAVGDWRLHYPGVTGQEATVMAIATSDSNNTKVIVNTTTATNASMGGGKCIQLTADNTISARLTFGAEL
jgi:hypothetical protein